MRQTIYIDSNGRISTNDGGSEGCFLLIIFLPPLLLPLYLGFAIGAAIYSLPWHIMFRLAAIAAAIVAEIAGLIYLFKLLNRLLPRLVFAILAMLYVGLCYGLVGYNMGLDKIWSSGLIVLTSSIVYFLLRAKPEEGSASTFAIQALKFVGANAVVLAAFFALIGTSGDLAAQSRKAAVQNLTATANQAHTVVCADGNGQPTACPPAGQKAKAHRLVRKKPANTHHKLPTSEETGSE
jgi:hypothetical protein